MKYLEILLGISFDSLLPIRFFNNLYRLVIRTHKSEITWAFFSSHHDEFGKTIHGLRASWSLTLWSILELTFILKIRSSIFVSHFEFSVVIHTNFLSKLFIRFRNQVSTSIAKALFDICLKKSGFSKTIIYYIHDSREIFTLKTTKNLLPSKRPRLDRVSLLPHWAA